MSIFYGGSRRSGIFKKRTKKQAPRTKAQRQVLFWWRVVITLALLLFLALTGTGIYKVTRSPSVTITDISVMGGETVSKAEVKERAHALLTGTYLFLIPRSFAYLYPHDEIVDAIARIPRVHDVRVERVSPTGLSIEFSEYVPYALWCKDLKATSTDPCLFVDRSGYAFGLAPHLSGGTLVRLVTETKEPEERTQVLPEHTLRTYSEFVQALRIEEALRISAITSTSDGDVVYHVSGGGDIMVSGDAAIQDVFDNLASVLDSSAFQHLAPGNFEYIDLRFDNKVYVKEIDDDPDAEPVDALPESNAEPVTTTEGADHSA